jgi:two-component system response regulator CpxR
MYRMMPSTSGETPYRSPEFVTGREDTPSILLVDDDRALCALMTEFFSIHNFHLDSAHDGAAGFGRACEGSYDLIILDWMLPSLSGIEILKHFRRRSSTPVILLSARTAQPDRIAALNAGADDYVSKPFGPHELLARVRAVLRRTEPQISSKTHVVQVGPICLDSEAREVRNGNKRVELTSFEFDVLEVLLRSAGRVVSRDELTSVLYQRASTPFERGIDIHICHLRRKLGPAGRNAIRSIRSIGYMYVVN